MHPTLDRRRHTAAVSTMATGIVPPHVLALPPLSSTSVKHREKNLVAFLLLPTPFSLCFPRLCSSPVLRLCSTSRHAGPPIRCCWWASMSSHPGPPPSCAEGPPPRRRLPRATGRLDSELADAEFFVRREHIFDAGLLRWSPDSAEPSTSFYSPTRHLPTSPAPTSTPPPASHRRPPPPWITLSDESLPTPDTKLEPSRRRLPPRPITTT
jgi:hypothetical protein